MKSCIKCENIFEVNSTNFYKRKQSKDGFESICKNCKKEYDKQYKTVNKEKVYTQCREWNKLNKEKIVESTQNWIQNNTERYKEIKKNSFKKHMLNPENKHKKREYDRVYVKQKRQNNIEYKIKDSIGSMINYHLKERKSESTIEYLGCSIKEYIVYLEQQFNESINWENYGTYWEIDHIVPLSKGGSFHYTNTQPLTITENRKKSNKLL
jgi:5-methylcytosine-specific restriction endonuclease McrA